MSHPSATVRCVGYRFGVFEVDLQAQEIRKHGIRLKMTGQPFQVLRVLLERPGEVVLREDFQKELWPDQSWGDHDHKLNKSINKVRATLDDSAETPRYIETLPRVGYRLLVPVERLTESVAEPLPAVPVPAPAPRPAQTVEPAHPSLAWRRRWQGAGVVLAVAIIALTMILLRFRSTSSPVNAGAAVPLTTWAGSETSPSFSPDGAQIVFSADGATPGRSELHILNLSSGQTRRLTKNPGSEIAPAWSPDGAWIAFLRQGLHGPWELRVIRPNGVAERQVAEANLGNGNAAISWSADGRSLYLPDRTPADSVALFRVAVDSGARVQVTSPQPGRWDLNPSVSNDGKWIAFTRQTSPSWREVFVAPLPSGAPIRQVTNLRLYAGVIAWEGSEELIVAAAAPAGGSPHLYRVSIAAGEASEVIAGGQLEGYAPAVSRSRGMLVFSHRKGSPSNIRVLSIESGGSERLLASNTRDYSPDYAPDGRTVVFSSIRSGAPQLWLYTPATGALQQLTNMGNAGASVPRWSPDGKHIAFESRPDGNSDIHVVDVSTGVVRRLTHHERTDAYPSWSRDGKSLYFFSDRGGQRNIWRMPADGGSAVPITRGGGIYAQESPDGRWIYFSTPEPNPELRRIPLEGGEESTLASKVAGAGGFGATGEGVYFIEAASPQMPSIRFLPVSGGAMKKLVTLDKPVHAALTVSPDGTRLLYTEFEPIDTDLMIVRNYR